MSILQNTLQSVSKDYKSFYGFIDVSAFDLRTGDSSTKDGQCKANIKNLLDVMKTLNYVHTMNLRSTKLDNNGVEMLCKVSKFCRIT